MTTTLSRDEQIIITAADAIGVRAVIVRDGRELVSDDEKILVYDNGATYYISKKDLYEPFPKKGGTE